MPILHTCASADCETLTMGEYCLACEERIVSERPELVEDLNAAVRDRRPDDD